MKRINKCEALVRNICKKRNIFGSCNERLIKKRISGQCPKNVLREDKRDILIDLKDSSIFKTSIGLF